MKGMPRTSASLLLVLVLCCPSACWAVTLRASSLGGRGANATLFKPNAAVVVCGLRHNVEVNGRSASVLSFDATRARYSLRLESGPRVQVDAAHVLANKADCHLAAPPLAANASKVSGTSVFANGKRETYAKEGCTEACDACYMGNLDAAIDAGTTPTCFAVCKKGCQMYCDESTAGIPGCSKNEKWEANVPGSGNIPAPTSLGAKHGPVCSFDHGKDTSCNRFRWCYNKDANGCPEDYLY